MEFTSKYDEIMDVVISRITGHIELSDSEVIIKEALDLSKEHGCPRIIYDIRDAVVDIPAGELVDVTMIADDLGLDNGFSQAIVVPKIDFKFQFFEQLLMNKGRRMKVFTDMEESVNWIREAS